MENTDETKLKISFTPIDIIIYIFLYPIVISFCINKTFPDFTHIKKKIMKQRRMTLYTCLYLVILIGLFKEADVLLLFMQLEKNSLHVYCGYSARIKMFLFDLTMFAQTFQIRVIRKQLEDLSYQIQLKGIIMGIISFVFSTLHLWYASEYFSFGKSLDGTCRVIPISDNWVDNLMINSLYIPFTLTLIYNYYRVIQKVSGVVATVLEAIVFKMKITIIMGLSLLIMEIIGNFYHTRKGDDSFQVLFTIEELVFMSYMIFNTMILKVQKDEPIKLAFKNEIIEPVKNLCTQSIDSSDSEDDDEEDGGYINLDSFYK